MLIQPQEKNQDCAELQLGLPKYKLIQRLYHIHGFEDMPDTQLCTLYHLPTCAISTDRKGYKR